MSQFEVLSTTASVTVLFAGDQPAARGPFLTEIATEFAQAFAFGSLGLQQAVRAQGQIGSWLAEKGQFKDGSKIILIDECRGSLTDLQVRTCDAETQIAERAMSDIWRTLCSLHSKRMTGPPASTDWRKLGNMAYESSATIRTTRSFPAFFPTAALLRDEVLERLRSSPMKQLDPMFRFAVEVPMTLGRRALTARVAFEPRHYSDDPGVLFTSSPLRSEHHLEMIEQIFNKTFTE